MEENRRNTKFYLELILTRTKLGIYGYGRFGSFVANQMKTVFDVIVTDVNLKNGDDSSNLTFLSEDEFFNSDFEIVLFANSINSFEEVIKKINPSFWKGKLVVDVLSVKEFAFDVLTKYLPQNTEIILTHPMFGPDSAFNTHTAKKKLVYYQINIINIDRYNTFLDFWKNVMYCELIYMSPIEHDLLTSRSQLITHFVGRILNELQLESTIIDTFSFQSLLEISDTVCSDSKELFLGLARKNKNTRKMIDDFKLALNNLISEIYDIENQLHCNNLN
jgi:prephenate dehydrogenase